MVSLSIHSQKYHQDFLNCIDLYELPFCFVILPWKNKQFAELEYACQLQSDALLSDFSSKDHELILLLFTDKYGKMPWEEDCDNYWPYICPDSLVTISIIDEIGMMEGPLEVSWEFRRGGQKIIGTSDSGVLPFISSSEGISIYQGRIDFTSLIDLLNIVFNNLSTLFLSCVL